MRLATTASFRPVSATGDMRTLKYTLMALAFGVLVFGIWLFAVANTLLTICLCPLIIYPAAIAIVLLAAMEIGKNSNGSKDS